MDNDWRECINIDQHLHMMTIQANISHLFTNTLLSFNVIVAVPYLIGDYVIRFAFLSAYHNDTVRQLPIRIQFPFEIQQSPIFEIVALTIFLHVMLQVWTIAILNALIFTLVIYIIYIYHLCSCVKIFL